MVNELLPEETPLAVRVAHRSVYVTNAPLQIVVLFEDGAGRGVLDVRWHVAKNNHRQVGAASQRCAVRTLHFRLAPFAVEEVLADDEDGLTTA